MTSARLKYIPGSAIVMNNHCVLDKAGRTADMRISDIDPRARRTRRRWARHRNARRRGRYKWRRRVLSRLAVAVVIALNSHARRARLALHGLPASGLLMVAITCHTAVALYVQHRLRKRHSARRRLGLLFEGVRWITDSHTAAGVDARHWPFLCWWRARKLGISRRVDALTAGRVRVHVRSEMFSPTASFAGPRHRRVTAAPGCQRLAEINQSAATTGDDPERVTLILRLHTETPCRRGGALALRPRDLDPGRRGPAGITRGSVTP